VKHEDANGETFFKKTYGDKTNKIKKLKQFFGGNFLFLKS
jgi:hypothetical protein